MNSATSKLLQFTSIDTTRRNVDFPPYINEMALQFSAAPFCCGPLYQQTAIGLLFHDILWHSRTGGGGKQNTTAYYVDLDTFI
jgi:hypothetical protein